MRKVASFLVCAALLPAWGSPSRSAESEGRKLLESRCGRCHAVTAGEKSALPNAPNLRETLGAYGSERLEFELAEGIGSRHPAMPQIQFTADEIASIEAYLAED
jgi:mono/diheme cytochrome c family protein